MSQSELLNKLNELQYTLKIMTENRNQSHKRFYVNKFKIVEGMTIEEENEIKKNITRRNEQARERYRKNKDTREKQQKRSREAYHKKKLLFEKNKVSETNISHISA